MFKLKTIALLLFPVISLSACTISLPNPTAFGTPFIAKGTYELREVWGGDPCPVWVTDTGAIYHLFQDIAVSNEDFDRVTTPGVTSRLQLTTRSDLVVGCLIGIPVEVKQVLSINE
ncbi:MAG: hypothetical protein JXQ75_00755 [Phycisphaerae bacterium]|nr:hypothetical protein [Phycisphaerae bacterium]